LDFVHSFALFYILKFLFVVHQLHIFSDITDLIIVTYVKIWFLRKRRFWRKQISYVLIFSFSATLESRLFNLWDICRSMSDLLRVLCWPDQEPVKYALVGSSKCLGIPIVWRIEIKQHYFHIFFIVTIIF